MLPLQQVKISSGETKVVCLKKALDWRTDSCLLKYEAAHLLSFKFTVLCCI